MSDEKEKLAKAIKRMKELRKEVKKAAGRPPEEEEE